MQRTDQAEKTFTAAETLAVNRRVRIADAPTTDNRPEVVYADAGEQHIGFTLSAVASGELVTVRMRSVEGTQIAIAADSFALGAVLYGANDGKVSDSSSGTAIGRALEAATADGDGIEVMEQTIISTTAATISIADAGSFTAQTTVEAATQELYQNAITVQGFIPISVFDLRESSTMNVGNIAANGGLLASDTTPVLAALNGATSGTQAVTWVASNNDQVIFQTALPPNLDDTADVKVHCRIKSGGTTDAVGFTVTTYWDGGAAVADTTGTNQTTTIAEVTATVAAADVPASAQNLTVALVPVAHTTDTMVLTGVWIEYKTKILTS